ncbi:AraC family transcriptional regulator [Mesorhizobium sp. M0293]|uniref:AraC family transcriptional regulator n=1 Tax=unclassified Mesorhizobium TaxID=325217 RepID=UPI00333B555E
MPVEMQLQQEQDQSVAGRFEMRQRLPDPRLQGIVSDICGYRELAPGHMRNVEYASLTVPLVISFAEPFAIGLGEAPGDNDRFASFAAGLYAGPVVIESFGGACCNRALGLSRQRTADWADIAADCGYSDQAHLVREFRGLAGETPTSLAIR